MCNCEYCVKCDICGHKADEHMCGDGPCFRCNCTWFHNDAALAWDRLDSVSKQLTSFEEFANRWIIQQP